MVLLPSSFLGLPPSSFLSPNQQANLILPQYRPPKSKPSTFKITSLTAISIDDIVQLAHNKVLIAAGASAAIGQLSKPFTSVFLYGKEFDIKAVIQAGGFPSTHSSATVASATFLGLERGFSDPIFGFTVVYAGLIMYDAQGVRREVGNHAKILNKLVLQMQKNSVGSKDRDDGLINSQPNVQGLKNSIFSRETDSLETQPRSASMLVESDSKRRQTNEELSSSGFSADAEELSILKESIGHTEVEVIAGALLGFLVGLAVYNFM